MSSRPTSNSSLLHDKLVLLLVSLIGNKVIATLEGGIKLQGILSSTTTNEGGGEIGLVLKQVVNLNDLTISLIPIQSILAKDLLELTALEINLNELRSSIERESFKTDLEVTGQAGDKREKRLQAWGGGDNSGGIEGNGGIGGMSLDDDNSLRSRNGSQQQNNRNWDQFATHERMYGTRSDYHEDIYTTKLDRSGTDYRAREQRAAQLEKEILKGNSSLATNAHMAEERGVVDDSGLDEEDRYGAVIRGPAAYVPPGARKGGPVVRFPASLNSSPAPSPPLPTATTPIVPSIPTQKITAPSPQPTPPILAPVKPVTPAPRTLEGDMRGFVSAEKERLVQKRQALVKSAEKKDQDSRIASLVEFSQTFKLTTPMPPEIASMMRKDPNKLNPSAASSSATPAAVSPIPPPRSHTLSVRPAFHSTLIAEIPPFNPAKSKAKLAANAAAIATPAVPVVTAITVIAPSTTPATPSTTSTKINANAPVFVFRPTASTFTPSFTPSAATSTAATTNTITSPVRKPSVVTGPTNPFFGNKTPKKDGATVYIREDFTPYRNGMELTQSVGPSWGYTGKPYRAMYPTMGNPVQQQQLQQQQQQQQQQIQQQQQQLQEQDPNNLLPGGGIPPANLINNMPPPNGILPPQGYVVYNPYQLQFNGGGGPPPQNGPGVTRFQPGQQMMPPQQQQQHQPNGTMQFQPYPPPPMGFVPGPHNAPMYNPNPQMPPPPPQQFMRFGTAPPLPLQQQQQQQQQQIQQQQPPLQQQLLQSIPPPPPPLASILPQNGPGPGVPIA